MSSDASACRVGSEGQGSGVCAYLGLGASVGDRLANLLFAVRGLGQTDAGIRVIKVSSVYETPHLGLQTGDEHRFPAHLNCVVYIETHLTPLNLLDRLQEIENAAGRVRDVRWGPRTLDIDLLLYADLVLQHPRLTLPHPGIAFRNFVLVPLFELAPDLILPDGTALRSLHSSFNPLDLVPLTIRQVATSETLLAP